MTFEHFNRYYSEHSEIKGHWITWSSGITPQTFTAGHISLKSAVIKERGQIQILRNSMLNQLFALIVILMALKIKKRNIQNRSIFSIGLHFGLQHVFIFITLYIFLEDYMSYFWSKLSLSLLKQVVNSWWLYDLHLFILMSV